MKICEPSDSAFPTQVPWELRDKAGNVSIIQHNWRGGLTKREYFAAMAMQGLLSDRTHQAAWDYDMKKTVGFACEFADALIDALNKEAT